MRRSAFPLRAGLLGLLGLAPGASPGLAQASPAELAIAPLPASQRAGATVLALEEGEWVELRAGTGEWICLADAPGDDRFHAACYHRSLEPYMARGRELARQGLTDRGALERRWEEIDAGTLQMPPRSLLHQVIAEPGWDGDLSSARRLTVIYMPYATAADVGLPADPSGGGPWIMFPGRPTAHIMIPR